MTKLSQKNLSYSLFLILLSAALGANIWMFGPYLMAILMGVILSILCMPFFRFLKNKQMGCVGASLITVIALIGVIVLPATLFGGIAIAQAVKIGKSIMQSQEIQTFNFSAFFEQLPLPEFLIEFAEDKGEQLRSSFDSSLQSVLQHLSSKTLALAGSLPESLIQLTLAILSCFFFLKDGHKLSAWFSEKIPLEPTVRKAISRSFQDTAASITVATVAAALCQTVIILIGFWTMGVPGAFLASGLTFIFAWVPMLGATPVWVFGALFLIYDGHWGRAIGLAIFGIAAGLADNVVRPWILKGKSDMHPLLSLLAIFGGISLFGLLGVFIGPILVAILISLIKVWPEISKRHQSSE